MFNDPRDINRDVNYRDPNYVPPPADNDEIGWGLPAAILAVVLVIGGLFWFGHNTETQTAANEPRIERTTPPPAPVNPAPPAVNPAPPATAPQQ